mgnify:CR=1 FL=1
MGDTYFQDTQGHRTIDMRTRYPPLEKDVKIQRLPADLEVWTCFRATLE